MTGATTLLAAVLLLTLLPGMWRVARGPAVADRLQAALLSGTTGTAALIVLAQATGTPALRHVALVFALLASVVTAAFLRRPAPGALDG